MDFVVTSVESPDASALLQRIGSERFAVLVGSAASIWEPSGIPPGRQVSEALARIIVNGIDDPGGLLAGLVGSTAFEHLMLRHPRPEGWLRETIAATIAPAKPNPVHFAIAELLGTVFSGVITTNYDTCIERAAESRGDVIHVVVTELDFDEGKSIDLLKIHGCAERPSTMVVTLADEASLHPWKRTVLSKTLWNSKLLVIGYSGLDFELCPELAELQLDEVVWVNLTHEVSGNADRVLRSAKSTLLVGDLREVLSQLVGRNVAAERGPVPRDIVDDLARPLSCLEMDMWRLRIFNGIGCGLQASRVGRRLLENVELPMTDKYAVLMGCAEAAFQQGLYTVANQLAGEAVDLAVKLGNEADELRSELERLQAHRAAGRVLRVWSGLVRLRRRFRDTRLATDVEYETRFIEVVVMHNLCDLMERATGISPRPLLKRYVLKWLPNIAESGVNLGRWVDYQQAEQIAVRFNIPFRSIYSGRTQPLRSRHGFHQIGYVIGALMSYRDDATTEVPELNEGMRLLRIARAIGCQPEVWKLTDVLLRHHPSAISRFDIQHAQRARRECQYTTVVRWLLVRRHRELFAAKIV